MFFDDALRDLPRAILLDMDGTLADSEDWWYQAETEIMADLGVTWSKEYVAQIVGSSQEYATSKIVSDFDLSISPSELGARLVSRVCEIGEASEVPWRPGAYELLALTVELGIPTALVTSSYERFARIVIDDAPAGSLTTLVAGDHGLPGKPDPAPYLRAAELTGAAPETSVVIEDSIFGVRSGMAARAHVVYVPYMVEVAEAPGLIRVDSLESIDEAALRRFMSVELPQGDPYSQGVRDSEGP